MKPPELIIWIDKGVLYIYIYTSLASPWGHGHTHTHWYTLFNGLLFHLGNMGIPSVWEEMRKKIMVSCRLSSNPLRRNFRGIHPPSIVRPRARSGQSLRPSCNGKLECGKIGETMGISCECSKRNNWWIYMSRGFYEQNIQVFDSTVVESLSTNQYKGTTCTDLCYQNDRYKDL